METTKEIDIKLAEIVLWMQAQWSTSFTTEIRAGWSNDKYNVHFSYSQVTGDEEIMDLTDLKAKGVEKIPIVSVLDMKGQLHRMQPVTAIAKPKMGQGVQETLQAVEFIAGIANMLYGFIAKPGIGWIRIVWNVIPLVKKAIPAIKGLSLIPQELDDLTIQEKSEVLDAISEHLEFSNDVEAIVNIALDIIYRVKILVGVFK